MKRNETNREKKVLIIDDEETHYIALKQWLTENGFGVIPRSFNAMEEASQSAEYELFNWIDELIMGNYLDLKLIICDIHFNGDHSKGIKIVKHIRELKSLNPYYWTSLIPIIGMTNHTDSLIKIVEAGANLAFNKTDVFTVDDDNNITFSTEPQKTEIIDQLNSYALRFEQQIEDFYPIDLEKRIKRFIRKQQNQRTAFIMIDFRHKKEYAEDVVKVVLKEKFDIIGYIADAPGGLNDKRVWENIEVFMHGCDFGIAIYVDDTEPDENGKKRDNMMNPNVCIEVGYMRGLKKDVLFFKHKSIPSLPSDLQRDNYASFEDAESLKQSLKEVVGNWIDENK